MSNIWREINLFIWVCDGVVLWVVCLRQGVVNDVDYVFARLCKFWALMPQHCFLRFTFRPHWLVLQYCDNFGALPASKEAPQLLDVAFRAVVFTSWGNCHLTSNGVEIPFRTIPSASSGQNKEYRGAPVRKLPASHWNAAELGKENGCLSSKLLQRIKVGITSEDVCIRVLCWMRMLSAFPAKVGNQKDEQNEASEGTATPEPRTLFPNNSRRHIGRTDKTT
jgi:hypothetical protein